MPEKNHIQIKKIKCKLFKTFESSTKFINGRDDFFFCFKNVALNFKNVSKYLTTKEKNGS